jgi:hypothetical protein
VHRLLRQIRSLKAEAAPLIAERNRREKYWFENVVPPLAEEHLLRVILVFRYGKPRIDEPLALAHQRALSKLGIDEASSVKHVRRILEKESLDDDIKSEFCTWVGQMPDWLRYLCAADISMNVLKLEVPLSPLSLLDKLSLTKSDMDAWPFLPQGMLEPFTSFPTRSRTRGSARRPDRCRS